MLLMSFEQNVTTVTFKIILIFETGWWVTGLAHTHRHSVVSIALPETDAIFFIETSGSFQLLEEEAIFNTVTSSVAVVLILIALQKIDRACVGQV
jgi:hypothetical protein